MHTDISMDFHDDEVERELERKKNLALKDVGLEAEGDAKIEIENDPRRVDTGRLRASITHVVEGDDVYIGTNVEYAPFVELGHHTTGGNFVAGKPFLRPAAEGHSAEYRNIIESVMKNA